MLLKIQLSSNFTLANNNNSWNLEESVSSTRFRCSAAVRGVGSVGVRPGVDWGSGRRQILPPATSGKEDEDGSDDAGDQDQAGDRDPDGEVALREADGRWIVDFGGLKEKTIFLTSKLI